MFLTRFDIFWRFRGRIYDMFAVTPEVRNGMMNIYQISFWPCHFLLRTTLISFYDLFGMIFFPVWPLWHEFFSHKFFSHVLSHNFFKNTFLCTFCSMMSFAWLFLLRLFLAGFFGNDVFYQNVLWNDILSHGFSVKRFCPSMASPWLYGASIVLLGSILNIKGPGFFSVSLDSL